MPNTNLRTQLRGLASRSTSPLAGPRVARLSSCALCLLAQSLSLVEAQLFASTELAVITAIDASEDAGEAVTRLEALGMTQDEAALVLEMPLRRRTQVERRALFDEAERLRQAL